MSGEVRNNYKLSLLCGCTIQCVEWLPSAALFCRLWTVGLCWRKHDSSAASERVTSSSSPLTTMMTNMIVHYDYFLTFSIILTPLGNGLSRSCPWFVIRHLGKRVRENLVHNLGILGADGLDKSAKFMQKDEEVE